MARSWRFLVVDTSASARDAYRAAIQAAYPEARVVEAESGERALDLLRHEKADAIVSDQGLARMSGVELLEHARREHPDTKRLLVAAQADEAMEREAIHRARVHALLAKRDGTSVLRDRLGMLLRE